MSLIDVNTPFLLHHSFFPPDDICLISCIWFFVFAVNFVESFAFGSLISAVDPVATVAIFHAIDVDPVLNMLVFGESILNGKPSLFALYRVIESVLR